MEENKKKTDEEQKVSETSSEEKQNEPKPDEKKADEPKNEGEKPDEPAKPDEKKADEPAKPDEKSEEQPKDDSKPENNSDEKDAEILRLKTQISAMQSGIKPDCVEDAVAIAESYIKTGKSTDINTALSEVMKKYPNMKSDSKDSKKQGGFRIGAENQKEETTDESKLDNAFGIRKKK